MDYEIITVTTLKEIEKLGSALTLEGLTKESIGDYLDWIAERTPLKTRRVYIISGKTMNTIFGLTKTNAYPKDLNIVSVDLDDMKDFNKIIFARFDIGARWLDDIIDNNTRRQNEIDR